VSLALGDELRLTEELLDAVARQHALVPLDGLGVLGAQLVIDDVFKTPDQGTRQRDVRQAELFGRDPGAAGAQVGLEGRDGALQPLEGGGLGLLVVRGDAEPPPEEAGDVSEDLVGGEADPLTDVGFLGRGGAQQLAGRGAALRDVLGDGVGVEDLGAVGALKGRDLAERELGQELGLAVGLAHGEVGGNGDLEAIEARRGLDLRESFG